MDFLKTLLAYMTLLATLGVQEGPAPESVPTPTPLPAHITASPVPNQTETPTATPGPSASAAPALTPNTRYAKIVFGESGNSVKKLQNRLIELGYLPKGSADGQYGYQTYNAVKAFQKANRLSVDGVAGPATLTNLYENPNVVAVVEPTAVPTATPKPTLPPLATPDPASAGTKPAESSAPAYTPGMLAPLEGAYIISGADGASLYREAVVDGTPALVRPTLWLNASGAPVMSLAQLADCQPGWALMGSSADGLYTLQACGYVVGIQIRAEGLSVVVDGAPVVVTSEDAFLLEDTLYVTDAFLRTVLKAQTVFDADEKSLVLFLQDKSIAGAQD